MKEKLKGRGALVSLFLLIAGLFIWNKFQLLWKIGAIAAAIGAIGLVILVDWSWAIRLFWKLRTDTVSKLTYKTAGVVNVHESVTRWGSKKYFLRGELSKKTFAIPVTEKVYDEIKDGDRVKISALEYRVYRDGSARGVVKHRIWTSVEKFE